MEIDGREAGRPGEGPLWKKRRQVPGERKGLAPQWQRWPAWLRGTGRRGQTTGSRARPEPNQGPCVLGGERLNSFPEA